MILAYTHARALLVGAGAFMLALFGFVGTTHAAGDATVISYAVECNTVDQLPKWGPWGLGGGDNRTIEPADVQAFVNASNGNCRYVSGWSFEWGMDYPYPDDDVMGPSGQGTVFGPTNTQGVTRTTIYVDTFEGRSTWFRAVTQPGYYGFNGKVDDNDISSEFYCHTDLWHYDNNEVLTIYPNETYYCVLFTAPLPGSATPAPAPTPTHPGFGFERPTFERPSWERPTWNRPTFPRFEPIQPIRSNFQFPSFGKQFGW